MGFRDLIRETFGNAPRARDPLPDQRIRPLSPEAIARLERARRVLAEGERVVAEQEAAEAAAATKQ